MKINIGLIFIGGIQQHDVAQRHQQHLLGVGSDPARVFSFLVGPNNTNWNGSKAWANFYKTEYLKKKQQLLQQNLQYDRLDAECSNARSTAHELEIKIKSLSQENQSLKNKNISLEELVDTLKVEVSEKEQSVLRFVRKVGHVKEKLHSVTLENKQYKTEISLHLRENDFILAQLRDAAKEGAKAGGELAFASNPALGANFTQAYSHQISELSVTTLKNLYSMYGSTELQLSIVKGLAKTMTTSMFSRGRQFGIGIPSSGIDKDLRYRLMVERLQVLLKDEASEIYYQNFSRILATSLVDTIKFVVENNPL